MSGKNPIPNEQAYQGVRAVNPPNVKVAQEAPGSNQKRVQLGDIQIDDSTGIAYMLTDIVAGAQVWSVIGEGTTGDIITITGDVGGAKSAVAGNFNIFGTASQVLVSGSAGTETISLIGPYAPSTYTDHAVLVGSGSGDITAIGVGTTGQVLIGATGADPAFGSLGVNSGLTAHGVLLGENNSAIAATAAGTTGQVLIGSTGADPSFGALGVNSGLTAHGVLLGENNSAIAATAAGTTGQVLIGSTGADPAFGALGVNSGLTIHGVLLGENNSAIAATAAGTTGQVLIGSTGADPAFGDLGVNSGLTDHGVIVGSGNSALTALSVGTNGQVLIGSTGADPVFATLTSDGSISFTPGAGTLVLSTAAGSAFKVASITLTSPQIKNLVGTPIQLLPAPGLGNSILIQQIQSKLVFGSNVFTNPQNLDVRTAGGNLIATILGSGFVDAAVDTYNITQPPGDTIIAATGYENLAINIVNTATDITGNVADDNSIVITVLYSILTQ